MSFSALLSIILTLFLLMICGFVCRKLRLFIGERSSILCECSLVSSQLCYVSS